MKSKYELIDYFMIFAIIFFMFVGTMSVFSQEKRIGLGTDNENIYGTWQSWDGSSVLYMNYSDDGDTFYRMSDTPEGNEVAEGTEGAVSKTRMGIRYPELLSFVAAYNEQRFANIEARITALE